MPEYRFGDVVVLFPYQAYECQIKYMESVVRALDKGANALLESPTGTGKTLCLLCATLGWRRAQEARIKEARTSWEPHMQDPNDARASATSSRVVPRIYYASRTHSQLKQVIKELKQSGYKPWSTVLASREHFCLHTSVARYKGAKQNAMCHRAREDKRCPYFMGCQRGKGKEVSTSSMDIEEMTVVCKDKMVCPFYKSRDEARDADIVFVPYDYLINPGTRQSLQISLNEAIIIFDEGHNIEKACEESASFEVTIADIAGAIAELEQAFDIVDSGDVDLEVAIGDLGKDVFLSMVNLLKKNLLALQDSISSERLRTNDQGKKTLEEKGAYVLRIFGRGSNQGDGFTRQDLKRVYDTVQKVSHVLTFSIQGQLSGGERLSDLLKMIQAIFRESPGGVDSAEAALNKNYRVFIHEDESKERRRPKRNVDFWADNSAESGTRTLCFWCFSSSVAMNELQKEGVRSMIITSGTLSPMEGMANTLGVPFTETLENAHVIDSKKQVWSGILQTGPGKVRLNGSYEGRSNSEYLKDLGGVVLNLTKIVPDGILLAFGSYAQKQNVLESWKNIGMYEHIHKEKQIFDEPKSTHDLNSFMAAYNTAIDQHKGHSGRGGAILAAVCRGKLCEGIDFSDKQCRMVVMIGLPYPAFKDDRVNLKRQFLDSIGKENDGRQWYERECLRAINQAVGRVIRHKNDFGGVLLCDERYASGNRPNHLARGLPGWLRPSLSIFDVFSEAYKECKGFFNHVAPAPGFVSARAPPVPVGTVNATAGAVGEMGATGSTGTAAAVPQASTAGQESASMGAPLQTQGTGQIQQQAKHQSPCLAPQIQAPGVGGRIFQNGLKPLSQLSAGLALLKARGLSFDSTEKADGLAGQSRQIDSSSNIAANRSTGLSEVEIEKQKAEVPLSPLTTEAAHAAVEWLTLAKELVVASGEFDQLKDELREVQSLAKIVHRKLGFDESLIEASQDLGGALKRLSIILIPTLSFDSKVERAKRHRLLFDYSQFLPRRARKEWRRLVEEQLLIQGTEHGPWGTIHSASVRDPAAKCRRTEPSIQP